MNTRLQDIVDDFELFDDWEERYRYLIDLGRALPKMDDALKTEQTLVRGCTSRVWMAGTVSDANVFSFVADSDAHIVRGLVALLDKVYNGVPISDLAGVDIEGAFAQIGLDQHLSPNRRSGFFSMVERIKSFAV